MISKIYNLSHTISSYLPTNSCISIPIPIVIRISVTHSTGSTYPSHLLSTSYYNFSLLSTTMCQYPPLISTTSVYLNEGEEADADDYNAYEAEDHRCGEEVAYCWHDDSRWREVSEVGDVMGELCSLNLRLLILRCTLYDLQCQSMTDIIVSRVSLDVEGIVEKGWYRCNGVYWPLRWRDLNFVSIMMLVRRCAADGKAKSRTDYNETTLSERITGVNLSLPRLRWSEVDYTELSWVVVSGQWLDSVTKPVGCQSCLHCWSRSVVNGCNMLGRLRRVFETKQVIQAR